MVRTAQKTLYATDLHLSMLAGKPYTPLTNTTLNEKFGINQEAQLPSGVYPTLKYFAIGAGGTSMINYDDNYMHSELLLLMQHYLLIYHLLYDQLMLI